MTKNKIISLLCIFVLVFALSGCGDEAAPVEKDQLVKTQKVTLGADSSEGVYSGAVRGRYETNMAFQVGGRILSRNVQLGDRVSAGQVLMVIDARDVVQQSNQGEAQVSAAKAQLDLARSNLSRYQELYAQEAIPASVLDQFQTSYDAAVASYEAAVAQSAMGHNAVGYTNLAAGASGVISSISAEAGQVVGAGQTVMTLVQTGELEVEINVPENRLSDVPVGQKVDVNLWAQKGKSYEGIVREVSPMADPTARTFKVRVSLLNPPADIQLGMTASVVCQTKSAGKNNVSAVLPLTAIYQTGDTPNVWIVNQETMTLELKKIQMEPADDNKAKVLGLSDGDIVVTAGVHKLREGDKVRLMDGEQ